MFCGWGCRCGKCYGCNLTGWERWQQRFSDVVITRKPTANKREGDELKRVNPGDQLRKAEPPIDDKLMESDFPTLYDYLKSTTYEDGSNRLTATLLFFVDSGSLKCCFSDRDNGRQAFVTATDLMGVLIALETGLANNSLDWRSKRSTPANDVKVPW